MAIYGDLSEVGDDEKEENCRKRGESFVGRYEKLMNSAIYHLSLPGLLQFTSKM
jgi:hypothetical protein